MPRNGESGIPASMVAMHGAHVAKQRPEAPNVSDFTLHERLAYRALTGIRLALGMSVHDTPAQLAEAVTELVARKGPTETHAVMVDVRGTEYAVTHQVAAEIARLRDAARGSLVLVQMALDLRDEAADLLSEAFQVCKEHPELPPEWAVMARSVLNGRAKARAAAGEG